MKSLRFLDRRAGFSLASLGLLMGVIAPSLVPAFASAGTLTTRSMAMSSAAASAQNVSYTLNFTPETGIATGGGVEIDFCTASPLLGTTCTAPDINTSSVALGTVKFDTTAKTGGAAGSVAATNSNKGIAWTVGTDAVTASTPIHVEFTGINNPSTAETFYARVTTYKDSTDLGTYVDPTSSANLGTVSDSGSIALATSDSVGVTAYVLESMTFCVAKVAPTKNCTGISGQAPNVTLGETTGSVIALDSTHLSTQTVYSQLSTNASTGAVVSMKTNATGCGGLFRNGNPANCEIAPQNVGPNTIAAGQALFGLELGTAANATDASAAADHTGDLIPSGSYSTSKYFMEYDNSDATGVTSTYGSPVFNTNGGVVSNMNLPITLGASISNQTPAGAYGANLSLIATGKF